MQRRSLVTCCHAMLINYYGAIAGQKRKYGLAWMRISRRRSTIYRRRSTSKMPLFRIDPFNLARSVSSPHRIKLCVWKSVSLSFLPPSRGSPRFPPASVNMIDLYLAILIVLFSKLRIDYLENIELIALAEERRHIVSYLRMSMNLLPVSEIL